MSKRGGFAVEMVVEAFSITLGGGEGNGCSDALFPIVKAMSQLCGRAKDQ